MRRLRVKRREYSEERKRGRVLKSHERGTGQLKSME
jgi:hypothetical protein